MDILLYTPLNLGYGGGVEHSIMEVAPRLMNRGHKINIMTTKGGIINDSLIKANLIKRGINVAEIDNYTRPLIIPTMSSFGSLLNAVNHCDIVYFNKAFAGNEVIMEAIRTLTGRKVIAAYHAMFPNMGGYIRKSYYKVFNKSVNRFFDAHHVVNSYTKELLLSYGYKKVYYIPNGVNVRFFRPGNKNEIFTILFVGRLAYQKGIDIYAKTIDILNKSHEKNIRFLIAGEGEEAHIVLDLGSKYTNVKWLGYVPRAKLVQYYQGAHVLVAPSRFEEFLITSIEAQACGTPVIATNIAGPKDNVINGATGFLTGLHAEDFVDRIIFFYNLWDNDRKAYKMYSKKARENAVGYDWGIVTKRLEAMFEDVLNS